MSEIYGMSKDQLQALRKQRLSDLTDEVMRLRALNAELLAALETMLQQGDFSSPHWAGDQARAVIAKAKSDTP